MDKALHLLCQEHPVAAGANVKYLKLASSLTLVVLVVGLMLNLHERDRFERAFGTTFTDQVFGKCDARIRTLVTNSNPQPAVTHSRFVDGPSKSVIYPVSNEDGDYILSLIDQRFGVLPRELRFVLLSRGDGINVHIIGDKIIDAIQFDGCGNLTGDTFEKRIRDASTKP